MQHFGHTPVNVQHFDYRSHRIHNNVGFLVEDSICDYVVFVKFSNRLCLPCIPDLQRLVIWEGHEQVSWQWSDPVYLLRVRVLEHKRLLHQVVISSSHASLVQLVPQYFFHFLCPNQLYPIFILLLLLRLHITIILSFGFSCLFDWLEGLLLLTTWGLKLLLAVCWQSCWCHKKLILFLLLTLKVVNQFCQTDRLLLQRPDYSLCHSHQYVLFIRLDLPSFDRSA